MNTIFNHNVKFGDDNSMILNKTQSILPLFEDVSNVDRTIDKIQNLTNIVIKGKGFNKDGKLLLSLITKKSFDNNNLTVSITEDDFLEYKNIRSDNKSKYRGNVLNLLNDILSTNYSYTKSGSIYNCNFLDSFIEKEDHKGAFIVNLGMSYINTFISDSFYIKYPVSISNKINGDVAERIYSFLRSNDYFNVNRVQVESIRTSCFHREDLTKENIKYTNLKIKNSIIQLEKLKLISNVEIIYKGNVRKIIDDIKFSIVSQCKDKPEIESKPTATAPESNVVDSVKDKQFEYKDFVPFLEHNPEALKDNTLIDTSIIDDDLPF